MKSPERRACRRQQPHRVRLLAALLPLGLGACGGTPPAENLAQTADGLAASLSISPYPPRPMQDTALDLALEESGSPVLGATVNLTLTMPGCTMAPSYLDARAGDEGHYLAETVLTMAGAWRMDAQIQTGQQRVHVLFFFATR